MILALVFYLMGSPASAYAAFRYAKIHRLSGPEGMAFAAALLPPMGAVLAVLLLTKELSK